MRISDLSAMAIITLVLVSLPFLVTRVNAEEIIEGLSEEQSAFANRMVTFMADMDAQMFDRIAKLNGGLQLETATASSESSDRDIKVTRGPIVEKAGRMIAVTRTRGGKFPTERYFSRRLSFDIHPETPLVGMIHAVIQMHYDKDGTSAIGGWLGVMPGATGEEDLAYLKQTMDDVYDKYGVDPEPHRKLICEGHAEDDPFPTDNLYRRKPACVGGSFFTTRERPMMSVTENNYGFMTEAFERFVDAYMSLIERRKDDPYTAEDLAAQDAMRLNWLEDRLFSDPFTTNVTSYEAWSLATLPPEVKF